MKEFFVECKPEECLLMNLGISRKLIRHHNGRGRVCSVMEMRKNTLGLIDEDPRALHHRYYLKLSKIPVSEKFNIRYCRDGSSENSLIILKSNFEEWIIYTANESKLMMSDFGLPNDPNTLHKIILTKITELQSLIHQLIKLKNPGVLFLQDIAHF